jgi:hypothetical protein
MAAPRSHSTGSDPLRIALVEAQRAAQGANEAFTRHRAAVERARGGVRTAESGLAAAMAAVNKAREEHASALVDAAFDSGPLPASGMPAVRQAIADAEDQIAAAKAAHEQLKVDLPAVEAEAQDAAIAAEAARSAVLAVEAQRVFNTTLERWQEFEPLLEALAALASEDPARAQPDDYHAAVKRLRPLAEVRAAAAEFFRNLRRFADVKPVDGTRRDMWRQAREALRRDPNAPLPQIGTM